MRWSGLHTIVTRTKIHSADDQAKAIYYAAQQGWLEVSPGLRSPSLTEVGITIRVRKVVRRAKP
jgi:hypothetical protein